MTEELKQHEIKTAYVLHGERIYYIDAENPEDAEERFNKRHLHDNLVKWIQKLILQSLKKQSAYWNLKYGAHR